MIDLKLLINNFDETIQKLSKRNIDENFLKYLKEVSLQYKQKKIALESLQATQNTKSKLFAQYKQEGKDIFRS